MTKAEYERRVDEIRALFLADPNPPGYTRYEHIFHNGTCLRCDRAERDCDPCLPCMVVSKTETEEL